MSTLRSLVLPAALLFSVSLACDSGGDDAKADAKKDAKADAKKDTKADAPKEKPKKKTDELALPWMLEDVRDAMRGGATLVYAQTGTDTKGKKVEDDYKCEIKKSSKNDVGTVCNGVNHPSKDKGATMVATKDWTQYSPFFTVDRSEDKLVKREKITVPAGEFDTVQVERKGFFGNVYTVWLAVDKPGIYAKVIKHPNPGEEDDKTNLTFELKEVTMGKDG